VVHEDRKLNSSAVMKKNARHCSWTIDTRGLSFKCSRVNCSFPWLSLYQICTFFLQCDVPFTNEEVCSNSHSVLSSVFPSHVHSQPLHLIFITPYIIVRYCGFCARHSCLIPEEISCQTQPEDSFSTNTFLIFTVYLYITSQTIHIHNRRSASSLLWSRDTRVQSGSYAQVGADHKTYWTHLNFAQNSIF